MKPITTFLYCLLSILLVVGCSDSSTSGSSKALQNENNRLSKELEREQQKNEVLEKDVKGTRAKLSELESEIRNRKYQSERQDNVLSEFVEFTQDENALQGALLKYFGFNDISRTSDAYIDLCNLGLWGGHGGYWNAMHYYATRSDRGASNIESLFNKYKSTVFQAITKYVYDNSYANEYVAFLLASRKNIISVENYEEFFEKLSADERIENSSKRDELLAEYENQFGVMSEELALLRRTDSARKNRIKYWGYSFWYRRHKEGNEKVVDSVLNEIAMKYAPENS